jgi:Icc-related predicted phosphoesterase
MSPWRTKGHAPTLTLFFATDIHGSDRCFRKFLNAADFYKADVLIMGGDLTGKMLIPITPNGSGWRAEYAGRELQLETRAELAAFVEQLADAGIYSQQMTEEELEHLRSRDQQEIESLIAGAALASVERWVQIADERMAARDVQVFMAPGNDDVAGVEEAIKDSTSITNPDGRCLDMKGDYQLVATGYSNVTPWRTDRELTEDELERLMDGLFADVRDPTRTVASLHVPPYNSGLDVAPRLDENLRVQYAGGDVDMVPVGSTAVRAVIERHQPLLALHGHIHESQGRKKLAGTLCINPGSEYTEGVLRGVIVRLRDDKVISTQFVKG